MVKAVRPTQNQNSTIHICPSDEFNAISLFIANTGDSPADVSLYLVPNGSSPNETNIMPFRIEGNDIINITGIALDPGDALIATSSTGMVNFIANIVRSSL